MIRWLRLLALLLLLSPSLFAAEPEPPLRLEPLAEGVWAALQPEARRFNDSNSLVVVGEQEVLVVDSQASLTATRWLAGEIARLAPGKPVRYVVNTHWHGDHTQGNQIYREIFGPGVLFIGQQTLREDVPGRAAEGRVEEIARYQVAIETFQHRLDSGLDDEGEPLDTEQLASLPGRLERARKHVADLHTIEPIAPGITFDDRLTLHLGPETEVHLLGFVAHTRGDTVIHLPKQKILVTGDLLDELPYAGHGYPAQWTATLDRLERLSFDAVVPGHGPVMRGKDRLRLVRQLLVSARRQAQTAVASGLEDEAALEAVDLERFRQPLTGGEPVAERNFDHFIPALAERALAEARGELDSP